MDNIESVESIAWKLLVDDDDGNVNSKILDFFVGDDFKNEYEKNSITFQIMISIFMEMVITSMMMKTTLLNMDDDGTINNVLDSDDISYDLKFDLDEIEILKDKIFKTGYQLCIHEVSDYYDTLDKYYCRILFKKCNENHFKIKQINKEYTFLLRTNDEEGFNTLKDFYAITEIDGKKLQIYFDKI
jgi:hypothetical protein